MYEERRYRQVAVTTTPMTGAIAEAPIAGGAFASGNTRALRAQELYDEVLRRLASVEEAVAALSVVRAGIGDNHPPEPIELDGFNEADRQAVQAAASILRMLPAVPQTVPDDARRAAEQLATIGAKTKGYAIKQGDNFVSEIVKQGAKVGFVFAAGGVTLGYVLYPLADRLLEAAESIQAWLEVLGSLH
jgi:hypothetical protein